MLGTVGLDNQPILEVDEIDDVPVELLLTLELEATQTLRSQYRPQPALRLGRMLAHPFGAFEQYRIGNAPSPCSLRELSLSRKGRGI